MDVTRGAAGGDVPEHQSPRNGLHRARTLLAYTSSFANGQRVSGISVFAADFSYLGWFAMPVKTMYTHRRGVREPELWRSAHACKSFKRLRTVPRVDWPTVSRVISGDKPDLTIVTHLSMVLRIFLQCLDIGLEAIRVIALIHLLERVGRM